jgi:STE24 endopeptidase
MFSSTYRQIFDAAFIYLGGFAWAWKMGNQLLAAAGYGPEYEVRPKLYWGAMRRSSTVVKIPHSIAFVFIYAFISSTSTIPVSIYHTFVLEEKHGFNKTTVGTFVADLLKGWLVWLAVGVPFLSAFLWVFRFAGDQFVPYLMAFMWVNLLFLPMAQPVGLMNLPLNVGWHSR